MLTELSGSRIGSFKLLGRLGAGGFGAVYEALDERHGEVLALKVLHRMGGEELRRFKHEFRALVALQHPNLVRLRELFNEGGRWFFTMEIVRGGHFIARPSGASTMTNSEIVSGHVGGPPSTHPDTWRRRVEELVSGVAAIHRAGLLHCDLKPSNVLVHESGRVVIVDFGMSAFREAQPTGAGGTPRYMAPEQVRGEDVSEATDWYAVGALIYEALTGHPPFTGSRAQMLAERLAHAPKDPRELRPGADPQLAELCVGLLDPNPDRRPSGTEVLERLGLGNATEVEEPGHVFVGRERELEELVAAYDAVQRGGPRVVLLQAPGGRGKTTLLDELRRHLRAKRPAPVLLGAACGVQESVAFRALDAVVDQLSAWLSQRSAAEVDVVLPRHFHALVRLFPVLGVHARPPASRLVSSASREELRRLGFGALREMLGRVTERQPMAIFIDDVHWADDDSAMLLRELLRAPDPPRLLVVLAFRDEGVARRVVAAMQAAERDGGVAIQQLNLDPLPKHDAQRLAQALASDELEHDRAERIASVARGEPLVIRELSFGAGVEHVADYTAHLWERIRALSDDARNLLCLVAVAHEPVRFDALAAACTALAFELWVPHLIREGMVRRRVFAGREVLDLGHARIREAIVARLPASERAVLHRNLVEAFERVDEHNHAAIAFHARASGDRAKASHHGVLAAEAAMEGFAFGRAWRLYHDAIDDDDGALTPSELHDLWVAAAEAASKAGRSSDAADAYRMATRFVTGTDRLRLEVRASVELLCAGTYEDGVALATEVLRSLGWRMPSSNAVALARAAVEAARLRLRGFDFEERSEAEVSREALLRIDTAMDLMFALGTVDPVRGMNFSITAGRLALDAGEPKRVAMALGAAAVGEAGMSPDNAYLLEGLSRAAVLAERTGDPYTIAFTRIITGWARSCAADWARSVEHCDAGEAILLDECAGVAVMLDGARMCSQRARFWAGRFDEQRERYFRFLEEARTRANAHLIGMLVFETGVSVHMVRGEVERARALLDSVEPRGPFHQFGALWSGAELALYEQRPDHAEAWMNRFEAQMRGSLFLTAPRPKVEVMHLRARVALARARGGGWLVRRRASLGATRAAARIEGVRGIVNVEGLAEAIRAGAAAVRGDHDGAAAHLHRAEGAFARIGQDAYRYAAMLMRGRHTRGQAARHVEQEAAAWLAARGVAEPMRFAATLIPGFLP